MADKENVIREKVEHSGIFNFSAFYSFAHAWFRQENYFVSETRYSEKNSGTKKDLTIEWIVAKDLSDYFKTEMKIKYIITDLTDVEVEIDGKKINTNKGKVEVEITANIIRDPKSKWDVSAFTRFARDFYDRFIIPSNVLRIKMLIADDAKKFKEELKTFLELSGRR